MWCFLLFVWYFPLFYVNKWLYSVLLSIKLHFVI
nr:MAG TPA: hypothetical protein [Caudoviricetes sp.]